MFCGLVARRGSHRSERGGRRQQPRQAPAAFCRGSAEAGRLHRQGPRRCGGERRPRLLHGPAHRRIDRQGRRLHRRNPCNGHRHLGGYRAGSQSLMDGKRRRATADCLDDRCPPHGGLHRPLRFCDEYDGGGLLQNRGREHFRGAFGLADGCLLRQRDAQVPRAPLRQSERPFC